MSDRDELRDDLYDAFSMSSVVQGGKAEDVIDTIFADFATILRRQTGLSLNEIDLVLADARTRAGVALGEAIDNCVDVKSAVRDALDVIDERFGDDADSTNQGEDAP